MGKIANELALLRPVGNGDFAFARLGAAFEGKIGKQAKLRKISELSLNYSSAAGEPPAIRA
jgi:hypothetical protein